VVYFNDLRLYWPFCNNFIAMLGITKIKSPDKAKSAANFCCQGSISPTNLRNVQIRQHEVNGAKDAAQFRQHFC
jgi:hypothetical protein